MTRSVTANTRWSLVSSIVVNANGRRYDRRRRMSQTHYLDARRLLCPMPVIKVQDKVATLLPGDTLEVRCTDPGTRSDVPTWCRINGHRVEDIRDDDGDIVIVLKVGGTEG